MTDLSSSPAAPAPKPVSAPPAGNTSTGWLKIIALVFMFIDHTGAVVFPQVPELRMLGRIAFPIYCWCLIVGFHYTRSVPKYLLRILAVGLLVQPLYAYVMNHAITKPNIFLTLFMGLLGLWSFREKKAYSHLWLPVLLVTLATHLGADYGWRGVLFIFLLYACRTSRPAIAAMMIAYFLFWGTDYRQTPSILGIPLDLNFLPGAMSTAGYPFLASLLRALLTPVGYLLRMETYALLSLPFILIPFRSRLRLPLWLSYGLYPAHLLLVLLLKVILK